MNTWFYALYNKYPAAGTDGARDYQITQHRCVQRHAYKNTHQTMILYILKNALLTFEQIADLQTQKST